MFSTRHHCLKALSLEETLTKASGSQVPRTEEGYRALISSLVSWQVSWWSLLLDDLPQQAGDQAALQVTFQHRESINTERGSGWQVLAFAALLAWKIMSFMYVFSHFWSPISGVHCRYFCFGLLEKNYYFCYVALISRIASFIFFSVIIFYIFSALILCFSGFHIHNLSFSRDFWLMNLCMYWGVHELYIYLLGTCSLENVFLQCLKLISHFCEANFFFLQLSKYHFIDFWYKMLRRYLKPGESWNVQVFNFPKSSILRFKC